MLVGAGVEGVGGVAPARRLHGVGVGEQRGDGGVAVGGLHLRLLVVEQHAAAERLNGSVRSRRMVG